RFRPGTRAQVCAVWWCPDHPPSIRSPAPMMSATPPRAAYIAHSQHEIEATALTRGPWDPNHQHAGPPIAMVCRAIEAVAAGQGLTHIGRLTCNLLRPLPIGRITVEVEADYAGRNAAHYSARIRGGGKELARF